MDQIRHIKIRDLVILAATVGCSVVQAQEISGMELARLLASERTRPQAVDMVAASPNRTIPTLLLWTRDPPQGIEKGGLYVGLADVFGKLRTKESIPFLISNINLGRSKFFDSSCWKSGAEMERCLPAVAALIQIGPEASRAVMKSAWNMPVQDYHIAVFVVSQIKNVPEARIFLSSVQAQASKESYWADEGLKLFPEKP